MVHILKVIRNEFHNNYGNYYCCCCYLFIYLLYKWGIKNIVIISKEISQLLYKIEKIYYLYILINITCI